MNLRLFSVQFYLFLLLLQDLWSGTSGIRWLALATAADTGHIASQEKCDELMGLNKRQKKVCRRNVELMDYVTSGAKVSIDECQQQFVDRRWNCSMVDPVSVFGNVLNQVASLDSVQKKYFHRWKPLRGTREAAFVHAISAAGVAHSVTMGCSTGMMEQCGCDRSVQGTTREGFEWAGCSHNVAYGSAFCETFVDARERTKGRGSSRALMNLHNNKAGRMAIEDNLKIQCKCHGVSGSCEMKTCWKAMPTFAAIGQKLKDKFDGATEVQQTRVGMRKQLLPRSNKYKQHADTDLVYLEASPDFCDSDPKTGSLGTQGRLCNKDSQAIDGCDLLCCGRGYNTRRREVIERCMCKFHWCCYVKCQKCVKEVEEHFCR